MNQCDVPNVDFKAAKRAIGTPDVLEAFGLLDRFEVNGNRLPGRCPLPDHVHRAPVPNTQQFRADCLLPK